MVYSSMLVNGVRRVFEKSVVMHFYLLEALNNNFYPQFLIGASVLCQIRYTNSMYKLYTVYQQLCLFFNCMVYVSYNYFLSHFIYQVRRSDSALKMSSSVWMVHASLRPMYVTERTTVGISRMKLDAVSRPFPFVIPISIRSLSSIASF